MKVDLNVGAASKVVAMSGCTRTGTSSCGIGYRNG